MVSRTKGALGILSVVAVTTSLAACGGDDSPSTSDGESGANLTFVAYGGDGQEAMIRHWQDPFTAANPEVAFTNTSPADVAQVKAQVESGNVLWDVMAIAPAAAEQNCGTLFEKLDFSDVDDADLVEGAIGECYSGNFINATPFAYLTESYPDPASAPTAIEDFFDVEGFPGQRGIITNLQNGILEYPLLADGVAPGDLYPLDIERSLAKLDTIRDNTTFAPNVGALQQAVGSGQVDMFLLSDSRIVPLMEEGVDITIVWDVTVTSINGFAVPKGSTNVDVAEDFMAFVMEPEQVAGITETLGTTPINLAAEPDLSEAAQQVEVYGEVNTGETVQQDINWYAENFDEATTALTNWLAG